MSIEDLERYCRADVEATEALHKQFNKLTRQARIDSLIEAVINTAISWVIATVSWHFVGKLMGYPMTFGENQIVVGIFTVILIGRQYVLRRLFDGKPIWATIKGWFK